MLGIPRPSSVQDSSSQVILLLGGGGVVIRKFSALSAYFFCKSRIILKKFTNQTHTSTKLLLKIDQKKKRKIHPFLHAVNILNNPSNTGNKLGGLIKCKMMIFQNCRELCMSTYLLVLTCLIPNAWAVTKYHRVA